MVREASEPWMRVALMQSVRNALERPWVMDVDVTIKPLYSHQQGAQMDDNPHKPGRPSHVLHTFWVGNLCLVLDAVLTSGKQHSSGHAKAHLGRLLDELGDKRPALVRGDCVSGNPMAFLPVEVLTLPPKNVPLAEAIQPKSGSYPDA